MINPQIEKIIRENASKWPSTFLTRSQVPTFTAGALTSKTMANLDSQGLGPSERFKIGSKMAYPVENFTEWLIANMIK
mgnify:FL=1